MVLDPIPQSLPVHFFGSRPQPPTSPPESSICVINECYTFVKNVYIRHDLELVAVTRQVQVVQVQVQVVSYRLRENSYKTKLSNSKQVCFFFFLRSNRGFKGPPLGVVPFLSGRRQTNLNLIGLFSTECGKRDLEN